MTALQAMPQKTARSAIDRFTYNDLAGYDMDQPYQRGHVWGNSRRRNLIKSILLGLPIGVIVINDRFAVTRDAEALWSVIDGKQRLTAINDFVHDRFDVPRAWFEADDVIDPAAGDTVTFSQLSMTFQRHFRNGTPLAVVEASVPMDQEEMVFNLINFGGLAQGESDTDIPPGRLELADRFAHHDIATAAVDAEIADLL